MHEKIHFWLVCFSMGAAACPPKSSLMVIDFSVVSPPLHLKKPLRAMSLRTSPEEGLLLFCLASDSKQT